MQTPTWNIGNLTLNFTPLRDWRDNQGLPMNLPFTVTVDTATGALMQMPQEETRQALEQAYTLGSIFTGMMEREGWGRAYADDFLRFIKATIPSDILERAQVLEIGCGTGYLLSRLRPHCAGVLGVEPGAHSRAGAEEYSVPIVNDFFPSQQVTGPFDLVLSFCVLEHLHEPVKLLQSIAGVMSPGASLVVAVPDCEPYIEAGDISMLWHEHWNYFTAVSLERTLSAAGFDVTVTAPAGFGGTLYAVARPAAQSRPAVTDESGVERFHAFREAAAAAIRRCGDLLDDARRNGTTVGFYAPGRAINMLAVTGADGTGCRFFDDNRELWGTYFPGMPIPIESRADWASNPPELTVIMSRTFGEEIKRRLESLNPSRASRFITWTELFQNTFVAGL